MLTLNTEAKLWQVSLLPSVLVCTIGLWVYTALRWTLVVIRACVCFFYCKSFLSLCPFRGGILCKLWKAITDYRQNPTWGLNADKHSDVRNWAPAAQHSPLYLSIYTSRTFWRRPGFPLRIEQLPNQATHSVTGQCWEHFSEKERNKKKMRISENISFFWK